MTALARLQLARLPEAAGWHPARRSSRRERRTGRWLVTEPQGLQTPATQFGVAPPHTVEPLQAGLAPQKSGFVSGSMQVPPQFTCPVGHWHLPARQNSPMTVQVRPQAPQLVRLVWVSMQVPEQFVWPLGHWHTPPTQLPPVGQATPPTQRPVAPQKVGLVSGSMQVPPQSIWPAGHWQLPAEQTFPPVQVTPQAPQLVELVSGSTQLPLHRYWPEGQVQVHLAATQAVPARQAVPQAPQLTGSVWKLVQMAAAPVPQTFGIAAGQEQVLAAHCWVPGQAAPQAPQLLSSVAWVAP